MMYSATVIIPTTGASTLEHAIQSVRLQSHPHTRCWVVIDGPQFADAARRIIGYYPDVKVMQLPENVGADGYYGHRIYAAVGHLVNTDVLLYLDQDNWMDPDHVSSMIAAMQKNGSDWCHSLRKISDRDGNYLMDDDCESLGKWSTWVNDQAFLVDTSCYCIKTEAAVRLSPAWHGKWGQDRVFLANIRHFYPNWCCTGQYTLNYRLDGNPGSVTKEFFLQGNAEMARRYPQGFPWRTA